MESKHVFGEDVGKCIMNTSHKIKRGRELQVLPRLWAFQASTECLLNLI